VVTRLALTPSHVSDVAAASELLAGSSVLTIGDRNDHAPALQQTLREVAPDLQLLTPPKKKTVLEQWCQRLKVKQMKARDVWHLASKLIVVCHTFLVLLSWKHAFEPL
jgi:hypothetical protein